MDLANGLRIRAFLVYLEQTNDDSCGELATGGCYVGMKVSHFVHTGACYGW